MIVDIDCDLASGITSSDPLCTISQLPAAANTSLSILMLMGGGCPWALLVQPALTGVGLEGVRVSVRWKSV